VTIKEIHDFIDFVTAKERGGFNTTLEKNQALKSANSWLFNDCIQNYAVSTWANEALAPFKKKPYLDFVTDGTGSYAIEPTENFAHLLNITVIEANEKYGNLTHRVKVVNEDELPERLSSVLHKPTISNPCAQITGVGCYQFYPEQVLAGRIYFLRQPKEPKLVELQAGRTFTYDATDSVDLEWAPQYQNKVVFKALELLGINLDNEKIVQLSDALAKQNI
jgi:hypothetical protein